MQDEVKSTRAIVTVIGKDTIGIIAGVTGVLAENQVNILDINQTIQQEFFTMVMICDLVNSPVDFARLAEKLDNKGQDLGVEVRFQHEDIFRFMHRI